MKLIGKKFGIVKKVLYLCRMKTIVAGSRKFKDYKLVVRTLERYKIDKILSGHAPGADSLGERYALENNIPLDVYPARWKEYGRAAGPIRNSKMVEEADALIVFWNGYSAGTKDVIKKARNKGLIVNVIKY